MILVQLKTSTGDKSLICGGSYGNWKNYCRTKSRDKLGQVDKNRFTGFRIVKNLVKNDF